MGFTFKNDCKKSIKFKNRIIKSICFKEILYFINSGTKIFYKSCPVEQRRYNRVSSQTSFSKICFIQAGDKSSRIANLDPVIKYGDYRMCSLFKVISVRNCINNSFANGIRGEFIHFFPLSFSCHFILNLKLL